MKILTMIATFLSLVLGASNSAFAQASETSTHAQSNRLIGWVSSDIYRASIGLGGLFLQNPNGFDVPIQTHDDGSPDSSSPSSIFITISGERAIGWQSRQKRLWNFHYDAEDFDGLKLQSLTFGAGLAIDPATANALGGRLAVGANLGITRSASFFDSAVHPAGELWVSTGVQLWRFTLDLSVRERLTMGASLDDRSASPRTQTRMIALGWLF